MPYLKDSVCIKESRIHYNDRNKRDLYSLTQPKGSYGSKCFLVRSVECWNQLGSEIKAIDVFKKFKENVKNYFLWNSFVL